MIFPVIQLEKRSILTLSKYSTITQSTSRTVEALEKLSEKENSNGAETAKFKEQRGVTRNYAYRILQACERTKDLGCGRHVQRLMLQHGLQTIPVLGDYLIRLFVFHGSLIEANLAFSGVSKPSAYTWCAIISAHEKLGKAEVVFEFFHKTQLSDLEKNRHAYISTLKACATTSSLSEGRIVHNCVIVCEVELDIIMGNTLLNMYAKCDSLEEACNAFHRLPTRSVVSWGAMIAGHARNGECFYAFECFEQMQQEGIKPTNVVFLSLLKACANIGALEHGRLIHHHVAKCKIQSDIVISNTLIDMYAKCGSLREACQVFESLPERDTVSWAAMITGYSQHEEGILALECFETMQGGGMKVSIVMVLGALKACGSVGFIPKGRLIHEHVINSELKLDIIVRTAFIEMYSKCGHVEEAYRIFCQLPNRNVVSWNTIIAGCAQHGDVYFALELFDKMQLEGMHPDKVTYLTVLKACGTMGAIQQVRYLDYQISKAGLHSDIMLGNTLVDIYAKCGSLKEAGKIFDGLKFQDEVSWGAIISGYAQHGNDLLVLKSLGKMKGGGINITDVIYLSIFKACASLGTIDVGRHIHNDLIESGSHVDGIVGNAMIDMYAKCGQMKVACKIFDELPNRDVMSWSAIIGGYAHQEEGQLALECCEQMQYDTIMPTSAIYRSLLKICASLAAIGHGRFIDHCIANSGLNLDDITGSCLMDMYFRCGRLEEACRVFTRLPNLNICSWSSMVSGFAQDGGSVIALDYFYRMIEEGIKPHNVAFSSALKACAAIGAVEQGRFIHHEIIQGNLQKDMVIGTALVDMYAKSGSLEEACKVFNMVGDRDTVSWGAMILGYGHRKDCSAAVTCYERMRQEGIEPTTPTICSVLKACAMAGAIEHGRTIHYQIISSCIYLDNGIGSALIDMYAKCGSLEEAFKVFGTLLCPSIMSWNSMIAGYTEHGEGIVAIHCFEEMQDAGVNPNSSTLSSILRACASTGAIAQGRIIHCQVTKGGIQCDMNIATSLIDMYMNCRSLEEACKVFSRLTYVDDILWAVMISGCVQHGEGLMALEHYGKMQEQGIMVDIVTLVCILKACAITGAVEQGKLIHDQINKRAQIDVIVGTSLVDMYAKCGSLREACKIFHDMPIRNMASWGALIAGFAHHGEGIRALEYLTKLHLEGVDPDERCITSILVSCSHAGLLDEGSYYFGSMTECYGIVPSICHYNCLIDLLGRAGYLYEAEDFLQASTQPCTIGWTSLLSSCKMHGNIGLGILCFDQIIHINSCHASGYVLMSNMYADTDMTFKMENLGRGTVDKSTLKSISI